MGLKDFFKVFKAPEVQNVEPIIKEVQVPLRSRFTFAYTDIEVLKYYFIRRDDANCKYMELAPNTIFTYAIDESDNDIIFPIFKMPSKLPVTVVVSPKKAICIGGLVCDKTGAIKGFTNKYVSRNLEEVSKELNCKLSDEMIVTVMNRSSVILGTPIDGNIDLMDFTRYANITESLGLITN